MQCEQALEEMAELPQLIPVAEVAQRLAVSIKTVRRMLARGELRRHRLGRNVRVDAASVMRLIESVEKTAAVGAAMKREFRIHRADPVGQESVVAAVDSPITYAGARRKDWRVYRDDVEARFVMKYYGADGKRHHHRLPKEVQSFEEAEERASTWFERTVKRPAPHLPVNITRQLPEGLTFEQLGVLWTSGKLAEVFPDHVRKKSSAIDDARRLRTYVYPVIGEYKVSLFEGARGLELVERVLDALPTPPAKFSKSSRRQIIQAIHRLLTLAVYPAKLLVANPLPKGFLPKPGKGMAKAYLYPSEDAALMKCTDVPLVERLLFGLLAREGMRVSEALSLTWTDLDLERGVVSLEENKTDDPRTWALDPGVTAALRRWKNKGAGAAGSRALVFASRGKSVDRLGLASNLRRYVALAGIDRAQLFEATEHRMRLRAHDLRASFITVNLALGKNEAWITDRTGHKSSQMIYTYKRTARTHAELELGQFVPLVDAIPDWD